LGGQWEGTIGNATTSNNISEYATMVRSLFQTIGLEFAETTELDRQVVATFAFGMIYARGRLENLSPAQVRANTLWCLAHIFEYSEQQALDFAEHLIDAAVDEQRQPVQNAIIHRGIDGHNQWERSDTDRLRSNLMEIIQRVRASNSRGRPTTR
jgi:hypothetical protein